jgi:hypothetical protein
MRNQMCWADKICHMLTGEFGQVISKTVVFTFLKMYAKIVRYMHSAITYDNYPPVKLILNRRNPQQVWFG